MLSRGRCTECRHGKVIDVTVGRAQSDHDVVVPQTLEQLTEHFLVDPRDVVQVDVLGLLVVLEQLNFNLNGPGDVF